MLINRDNMKALFVGYNAKFNQAFQATESNYDKIATVVPVNGSEENYAWLNSFPVMREWAGDRIIENPELFGYSIKNRTFESTFAVKREDVEDDKYGAAANLASRLGELAKIHPDELVFGLLRDGHKTQCYDGQYFFDTDHPVKDKTISNINGDGVDYVNNKAPWFLLDTSKLVRPLIFQKRRDYKFTAINRDEDEHVFMRNEYVYGVDARVNAGYGMWQFAYAYYGDLTTASFRAARSSMRSMKDNSGRPLLVNPNTLVVPPIYEDEAIELLKGEFGDGWHAPAGTNVYKGTTNLIVSSWLDPL